MTDELRSILYPFGFLASFFFALRFLIQWILSEKKRRSHVTKIFWQLSLAGNIFFIIHAMIQMQFPICAIQACNAVISWRNLNLMLPNDKHSKFHTVILLFIFSLASVSILFIIQGIFMADSLQWIATPKIPWHDTASLSLSPAWHVVGITGMLLFASRFWVQWWHSERMQSSVLNNAFWWLSLAGAILATSYFTRMGDIVNIIGYGFGIIPYLRNLMLIRRELRPR